jgi:hypothetical protein
LIFCWLCFLGAFILSLTGLCCISSGSSNFPTIIKLTAGTSSFLLNFSLILSSHCDTEVGDFHVNILYHALSAYYCDEEGCETASPSAAAAAADLAIQTIQK